MKAPKPTPQEAAAQVRRNQEQYTARQREAHAALGFPLSTVDQSRGYPYMTLEVTPVESLTEGALYNVELKWRGLTADQVRQLRAALTIKEDA